ncbi:hypothetical protein AB205_0206990 [Aquarana catesbeiana]|uniref:Uncharacterized protein n=1 Tax=Aquarana catesbeiana TaxID=8400 RepID=A0A2G9R7M5_AQUCT|nr:hypothetical protein AB205_0206990 [Aquarana catesbeiana]
MASAARCPALCCCRRPLHPGPGPDSPQRFQPGPPDPASASSFQLYRLRHFHLGLELRPESRELSGCLVLELSPVVPGGPALVLDVHPVLRVSSVRCRRGGRPSKKNERPCSCPPNDYSAHHPWNPEDPTHGCQCKQDLGSSYSPTTMDPSSYANPQSSTVSPATAESSPVLTPEPLDLSVPRSKSSTTLPHLVPGDVTDHVSAGTGCPIINGHQPPGSSPKSSASAPFTSTASPATDLSSRSSTSCWSSDSLVSPTPDSGFATSSMPAPLSLTDIPASEALPCTFSQPCEFHSASDSAPAHSTCCFPLDFRVEEFTDYGSALTITVPETLRTNETFQVIVHYVTGEGPAIWWLDPELSYGSSELFVFTQGHSVCNRSFFPCFDTPAVKCTYSASVKVTNAAHYCVIHSVNQGLALSYKNYPLFDGFGSASAPAGIRVLMSCTHSYYIEEMGIFHFYMEHPVPAYLVALTAGHLLPADIGPRSRVWAEPCVLPLAVGKLAGRVEQWLQAAESLYGPYIWGRSRVWAEPCVLPLAVGKLAGRVEQWLQAAESLYGPYIWGRYDIVFLPPSFPIVAMENPCLTFVICSILDSEDFLLIDVIHEIAHGWFGNAVTNASWEEMWLSEGLATYAQRRITTLVYGATFTCLETTFRLEALHRQIRILGQDTPFSRLQAKLDPGKKSNKLLNVKVFLRSF